MKDDKNKVKTTPQVDIPTSINKTFIEELEKLKIPIEITKNLQKTLLDNGDISEEAIKQALNTTDEKI